MNGSLLNIMLKIYFNNSIEELFTMDKLAGIPDIHGRI